MTSGSTPQNIQLAAVAVPVLALVITIAIDSVEKGDSIWYRALIGGISALALATALSAILLGSFSAISSINPLNVATNLIYTSILVGILVTAVIVKESLRGLEDERQRVHTLVLMGIMLFIGFLILTRLP